MAKNIIQYIVENTDLRQKDLAEKLGVSGAQISKWKSGEYIPLERAETLARLAGLFTDQMEWIELVKTEENAKAWCDYMQDLNMNIGVGAYTLAEEPEIYAPSILLHIAAAGIPLPSSPPELEDDEEADSDAITELLCGFMESYGYYIQWAQCYLLSVDNNDAMGTAVDLESYAAPLALGHIGDNELVQAGADPKAVAEYVNKQRQQAKETLDTFCREIIKAGQPLVTDYFAFINDHPHDLDDMCSGSSYHYGEPSIEDYLSYGERKILSETREVKMLLESLHRKVDSLLSDDGKK